MDRTHIGGEKIMQDLKAVVSDTEALLHATAGDASERVVKARTRAEESLRHARTRMVEIEQQLVARAREAGRLTNTYVHENPWPSLGVAACAGVLAGLLLGRR